MSSELPNRFILNSDYMSLAQASNYETNIVLPAGRATSYAGFIDKDISLPTVKGAMARYLVSYETTVYNMNTKVKYPESYTLYTFLNLSKFSW